MLKLLTQLRNPHQALPTTSTLIVIVVIRRSCRQQTAIETYTARKPDSYDTTPSPLSTFCSWVVRGSFQLLQPPTQRRMTRWGHKRRQYLEARICEFTIDACVLLKRLTSRTQTACIENSPDDNNPYPTSAFPQSLALTPLRTDATMNPRSRMRSSWRNEEQNEARGGDEG